MVAVWTPIAERPPRSGRALLTPRALRPGFWHRNGDRAPDIAGKCASTSAAPSIITPFRRRRRIVESQAPRIGTSSNAACYRRHRDKLVKIISAELQPSSTKLHGSVRTEASICGTFGSATPEANSCNSPEPLQSQFNGGKNGQLQTYRSDRFHTGHRRYGVWSWRKQGARHATGPLPLFRSLRVLKSLLRPCRFAPAGQLNVVVVSVAEKSCAIFFAKRFRRTSSF
jgi:hypothetical protein